MSRCTNQEIAAELRRHPTTVGKWRKRFAELRVDGLHDEPRPGKPRTITDDDVERVIVKTLDEQPADATHWSTRSMANATGMSQTAIRRIWGAFGLKPHLVDEFKLSPDPQFGDVAWSRPRRPADEPQRMGLQRMTFTAASSSPGGMIRR